MLVPIILIAFVMLVGFITFVTVEKRKIDRELENQRKLNDDNTSDVLAFLQRKIGGRQSQTNRTTSSLHVTTTLQKLLRSSSRNKTINNEMGFQINHRKSLSSNHITIIAPWPDSGLRLSIRPDREGMLLGHLKRLDDIRIGALTFDRKYYIQSNEPELTKSLLNLKAQKNLLNIGEEFAYTIQGGEARLEFTIKENMPLQRTHFTHEGHEVHHVFLKFIATFRHMLLRFDHIADFEFIQDYFIGEVKVQKQSSPLCLICGEAVVSQAVNCSSCETPHHEDCWRYVGKCSTFACGELNFNRG